MMSHILKYLMAVGMLFILMGSHSQCLVTFDYQNQSICNGDTACINAAGAIGATSQLYDFNSGSLPAGWTTTGSTTLSTPCGPGPDGTTYYHASTYLGAGGLPSIATTSQDVTCGGIIQFDMKYYEQNMNAPCQGIDLGHEGVQLEYSLDGFSWFPIIYYRPDGVTLPEVDMSNTAQLVTGATPYTSWNTYSVAIPIGAQTSNTIFRWKQYASSGNAYDNWSLDNIEIIIGSCGTQLNWSTGAVNTNNICISPVVDTFYVAYVYDNSGTLQCQDTAYITVNNVQTIYETDTICGGGSYLFPDSTFLSNIWNPVTHTSFLTSMIGCDSVIEVTVIPFIPSALIYQNDSLLSAVNINPGVTYRWLDCNNNFSEIVGEVNSIFIATMDGYYAVEVTENTCVDTSICKIVDILDVGLSELAFTGVKRFYPNPIQDKLTIELKDNYPNVGVIVYDITGKLLRHQQFQNKSIIELNMEYASGKYLVYIQLSDDEVPTIIEVSMTQ